MRRASLLFLIPALLFGAAAAAGYLGQRRIVFQPDTARPALAAATLPGVVEVQVPTADGLTLLAWYLPPRVGEPVMLYLHGNGGNLANRAPRLRSFAGHGFGMLMLEWRGYGGNPGTPSEEAFGADADAAMAFLRRTGVGPERVILYGESIGTGFAVRLAAAMPVAALVLESPYTSLLELGQARFPWLPVHWLMRDPVLVRPLMKLVRAPVLILQGDRDEVIPPLMGRELFAAAPGPKQIWAAPDGGHNDLMAHGAAAVVFAFLHAHGLATP